MSGRSVLVPNDETPILGTINSKWTIAKPLHFLIVFTLCGCSLFWFAVIQDTRTGLALDFNSIKSPGSKESFTVSTEGCKIPAMTPIDHTIKKFLSSPDPEECDEPSASLLGRNKTHIWTTKKSGQQYKAITCCYRGFHRPPYNETGPDSADDRVQYHDCVSFSDYIIVKDEFVRVTCNVSFFLMKNQTYDQFFLFARKRDFVVHNDGHDGKDLKNDNSSYNILMMGIDSVSRLNLYRTMPKTISFLKNNGAVDFVGYNKVGDNTYPNLMPMLLGVSEDEMTKTCLPHKSSTFDNCPFVWKRFKQAGYYTALAEDSSSMGTFNYLSTGFTGTPTDYYLHTFISETEKSIGKCLRKLCSHDQYIFKILLDYAESLTTVLGSSKLFSFFWEVNVSHDYINHAAIMDDSYVEFFRRLEDKNYLNQTILILVSDHGMRFGEITHTKQGWLESRLPFLFILAPPSFRSKYSEAFTNLNINSRRLTTPYNLHATLNDLANLDSINNKKILSRTKEEYWRHRSISLFLPIPGNRTCQLAGISDQWCTCHEDVPISLKSYLAKQGSVYLINSMNHMLSEYRNCAQLSIEKLMDARERIGGDLDLLKGEWREVLLVVRTKPGQGEFEATLRHYHVHQWALVGQVGRLNLYGNQSHCVDDRLLKLYCYCV